jgi:hypothetical protein
MYKLFFISMVVSQFIVAESSAQMATASLFGENKAVNPAVISKRQTGSFVVAVSQTNINKSQDDISASPFGAGNAKTEVEMQNLNVFRGGRGNGITTEFMLDRTQGKKQIL